jgi:hypothetical protein
MMRLLLAIGFVGKTVLRLFHGLKRRAGELPDGNQGRDGQNQPSEL